MELDKTPPSKVDDANGGGGGGGGSSLTLPYLICLKTSGDFLKLEKFLRHQLQCQGSTCSFLQSADYAAVKIAVTHTFHGRVSVGISVPQIVCIPNSSLILCLMDNHSTIMVREQVTSVVPITVSVPGKKKRKCMVEEKGENGDVDGVDEPCKPPPPPKGSLDLSRLESNFVMAIGKQRHVGNAVTD